MPDVPYIQPTKVVALCFETSKQTNSQALVHSVASAQLARLGSAGGLVVNNKLTQSPFLAVCGAVEPAVDYRSVTFASPAARYPPKYGSLQVHSLTTDSSLFASIQNATSQHHHLTQPTLLNSNNTTEPGKLVSLIELLLSSESSGKGHVYLIHIPCQESAFIIPEQFESEVSSLLDRCKIETSDRWKDVFLSVINLNQQSYRSVVCDQPEAVRNIIPKQSYQTDDAVDSDNTHCNYFPVLSYHHETTRCDDRLYVVDTLPNWRLGSSSLIDARDWLGELAFRIGCNPKYGA